MQPLDKDALNSLQITSMREDTSEVIEPLHLRSDLLDSKLIPILESVSKRHNCAFHIHRLPPGDSRRWSIQRRTFPGMASKRKSDLHRIWTLGSGIHPSWQSVDPHSARP